MDGNRHHGLRGLLLATAVASALGTFAADGRAAEPRPGKVAPKRTTQTAASAFLKIGDIKGESTDDKHGDWIELSSFSFDGAPAPRSGTTTLTVEKRVDRSTAALLEARGKKKRFSRAVLEVRKGDSKSDYLVFELRDVLVSGYNRSAKGGDVEIETITFTFEKIQ